MAIALSGSLVITGSIFATQGITGSFSGNATSASYADTLQGLGSASFAPAATFNTVSQSFATTSGSLSTRVTNLESTSSTVSSSFASTSGSIAGRVTLIEGQYATTGSNTFTGPQYVSQASNAISFTSTASLYTDGGLRVSKDSFVSGTAYFNNVVVYGTSSIQYITSSQVNFGTNIITVNTDTPAVRFGGLSVFDSGSTGLTGSMLWDSEKNNWVYSNPSGSTYSGGMIISGPRNTGSLGNEVGTTSCALMMGQGGDHITSSAIFSYGNATCFYGQSYISSSGAACFTSTIQGTTLYGSTAVCSPVGKFTSCIDVGGTGTFSGQLTATTINGGTSAIFLNSGVQNSNGIEIRGGSAGTAVNWKLEKDNTLSNAFQITPSTTNGGTTFSTPAFTLTSAIACFSGTVCATSFIGGTMSGTTIYGSTAVCSPVGKFTTCIDAGSGIFSSCVGTTALNMNNMASLGSISGGSIYLPYTAGLFFRSADGSTAKGKIQADNSNNLLLNSDNGGCVGIGTTSPYGQVDSYTACSTSCNELLIRTEGGFAGSVYPALTFGTGGQGSNIRQAQIRAIGDNSYSAALTFWTQVPGTSNPMCERMRITSIGIASFTCQVCTPNIVATNLTTTNSICLSGVGSLCFFGNGESRIQGPGTGAYIGLYNIGTIQFNSGGTYDVGSSAATARCVFSTKVSATHLLGTCLTLNGFSSGNGLKMDYGSASGEITVMNLMANGTTNGFIGIQMVDGSNGDLWLGGSSNRSMTIYRTGNTGFNTTTPCTKIHSEGGIGSKFGCNGCFYGGGYAGGGFPYGDIYGNGSSYNYQTCYCTTTSYALYGGYAAGYFKGGEGAGYGGGGAGIVAIGGNGGNSEGVNSGGGAGIFARGGLNGAGSALSYAGWFDGGDVIIRCGRMGIGICNPDSPINVRMYRSSRFAGVAIYDCQAYNASNNGGTVTFGGNYNSSNSYTEYAGIGGVKENATDGNYSGILSLYTRPNGGSMTERLVISSDGSVFINHPTNVGEGKLRVSQDGSYWNTEIRHTYSTQYFMLFRYNSTGLGSIQGNGSNTSYYTTSDYRLKEDLKEINGLEKISAMKVYNYKWKNNDLRMDGMLAHELSNVLPYAVTGDKDALDKDGNIDPQGVDYSKIVPVLVKAIQEQQCTINTLKTCLGIN